MLFPDHKISLCLKNLGIYRQFVLKNTKIALKVNFLKTNHFNQCFDLNIINNTVYISIFSNN